LVLADNVQVTESYRVLVVDGIIQALHFFSTTGRILLMMEVALE
jgi:hypothetical protein